MTDQSSSRTGEAETGGDSSRPVRVTAIGGSALYRESVKLALEAQNPDFRVTAVASAAWPTGRDIDDGEIDVILVNTDGYSEDCQTCADSLKDMREQYPTGAVIVLCGHDPCSRADAAAKDGVSGFITFNSSVALLAGAVRVAAAGGTCFPASAVLDGQPGPRDGPKPPLQPGRSTLSRQQLVVLDLLCEGKSNKEIGSTLDISEGTVKAHVSQILKKLDVNSRTQAVLMASGGSLSA